MQLKQFLGIEEPVQILAGGDFVELPFTSWCGVII